MRVIINNYIYNNKHLKIIMSGDFPEVKVDVEYCGTCGHLKQYLEMAQQIKETVPNVQINAAPGRQASFEIRINDELVYSKLQTMAFPDFNEVTELVKNVSEGGMITKVQKQQPINCTIS